MVGAEVELVTFRDLPHLKAGVTQPEMDREREGEEALPRKAKCMVSTAFQKTLVEDLGNQFCEEALLADGHQEGGGEEWIIEVMDRSI